LHLRTPHGYAPDPLIPSKMTVEKIYQPCFLNDWKENSHIYEVWILGWIFIHRSCNALHIKIGFDCDLSFHNTFLKYFFRFFKHLIVCMLINHANTLVDYALVVIWKHSHSIEHPHIYITHTANFTSNFANFLSPFPSCLDKQ